MAAMISYLQEGIVKTLLHVQAILEPTRNRFPHSESNPAAPHV